MSGNDDPNDALEGFLRRRPTGPAPEVDDAAPDFGSLIERVQAAARAARGAADDGSSAGALDATVDVARAAPPTAARRTGTLRGGRGWRPAGGDEVTDVPDIAWPRAQPPAAPGAEEIEDATRQASGRAAAQWADDARASADISGWQPDGRALQPQARAHPRIARSWQPGAWIGAARQLADSRTELHGARDGRGGPVVQTHAPLQLFALWGPPRLDAPQPARWPKHVRLLEADDAGLAEALVAQVPEPAAVWLTHADGVDWALAAEIALHHEPGLPPRQIELLRSFIAATREADFARLNDRYARADGGGAVVREG